jgi:hypothetical protein
MQQPGQFLRLAEAVHQRGGLLEGLQVLAVPEPEATDIGAVPRAAALPESAAQFRFKASGL